ncbi:MAG: LysM peptidoglycan-binding domain-containing M23 family metallopeptidase [Candidatus Hydrogenedentes bacterium]|nr:LysM peptidoglycan-binding domain-containing M23 family metallopeptidase [Candidatus Hydrogenedentota bacterium]
MLVMPVTSDQARDSVAAEQPVQTASTGNTQAFDELMSFFSEKKGLAAETAPEPKTYTVQRGDNLWQICRNQLAAAGNKNPSRSEVNALVKQIAQASGLKDANVLNVGQKLTLTTPSRTSQETVPITVPDLRPVLPPPPPLVPASDDKPLVRTTAADSEKAAPAAAKADSAAGKHEAKAAPEVPDIKAAIASRIDPAFLRRREELLKDRLSAVAKDGAASSKPASTKTVDDVIRESASGVDVKSLMRRRISPEFLRGNSSLGQGGTAAPVVKTAATPSGTSDITMMIQSILEPGSFTLPGESKGTSPWSGLLEGGGKLSSGYGMRKDPFTGDPQFHFGVDIAADTGTKIYPYETGVVKYSGWLPGTGKVVIVQHEGGLETVYGHASATLVKRGQAVTKDTVIAEVGSTGRSTGPHLHFEARKNGRPIDPMPLLNGDSLHVAKTL